MSILRDTFLSQKSLALSLYQGEVTIMGKFERAVNNNEISAFFKGEGD